VRLFLLVSAGALSPKRVFIRAGPVNRRHIQHPQIHGKLPAMMIEMIHHQGTDKAPFNFRQVDR